MTENQLVSVIIPIYNVAPYLRECLDSIISQSYTNLEIILVDDGSTDNCPQICDEYAQNDKRIIVIHKANGGLSDARNAGMKIATADYWTFVDSDDYCHPKMIETLLKPMLENKDIKVSNCEHTSDTLRFNKENKYEPYRVLSTSDYFLKGWTPRAWGRIYSKQLFKDITFPKGRLIEDCIAITIVLYKSAILANNNSCLYFYRVRPNSIMHSPNRRLAADHKYATIECIKYFQDKHSKIYSILLSETATIITKYKTKGHPIYCPNSEDILQSWKVELKSFSLKPMNFLQKILFIYHIHFTSISIIINRITMSIRPWCPFLVSIKRWLRF